MKRRCFALLLSLMILLCLSNISPAQITPSPSSFEAHIPAGDSQQFSFKVFNLSKEESEAVIIYLGDWDLDTSGNYRYLEPGTLPRSCAEWISLSREQVEIESDSSVEITFTLDVPKESEGSYWAMIFVEPTSELPTEEAPESETGRVVAIHSKMRYAIPVYQTVPRTERREMRITHLDVTRTSGGLPLTITMECEDTGNTILRDVIGSVELKDRIGETVARVNLLCCNKKFTILPGATRKFELEYDKELGPGVYIALASIDYGGRALAAAQRGFLVKG